MNRTDKQMKAILHDEGNLVVTASAGSGKTSVMIERFLRLVVEKKARVKEILAVTFTKLAATEMKEKLAAALRKKIAEGKDAEYLKGELDDLFSADISTVHSFCSSVIRRYFYIAGVDPTFSVADEVVCDEIKKDAIAEVFEGLYEEQDERFFRLLNVFSRGRKDKALKEIVIDLFEFASQEADPDLFYDSALSRYTEEGLKTIENELIGEVLAKFKPIAQKLATDYFFCEESGETKYLDCIKKMLTAFYLAEKERTETAALAFFEAEYKKESKTKNESDYSRGLSDRLKLAVSTIKTLGKKLKKILVGDRKERLEKTLSAGETLKDLVFVIKLFEKEFAAEKAEKNVLDFSDLEHFTCKILKDDEARKEISSSYKYIFVDEYQDTNGAQEEIFSLLENDNLFVVGDVKQSIYAFRGSKPEILLNRASKAGKDGLIDLDSNFRSAKNIVTAVNNVFLHTMKKSLGGVEYSKEPMVYGGLYPREEGLARVETYEKEGKASTEIKGVYGVLKHLEKKSEERSGGRAALVCRIVEDTIGRVYYDENGQKRRFSFGDIMIVSRKNSYRDVAIFLSRRGIPVSSEAEIELKDYYEINMLVDILKTISTSASDDLALVSALKSRVAGLTDGDLLSIRKAYFGEKFSDAARRYAAEKTDALSSALREFYSYIERISLFAAFEGCATLLRRIIEEKGVETELLLSPRGEIKIKRVERFLNGLKKTVGEYTLAEFFAKSKSILDNIKVADPAGEDSVRIMTMHKAKGLEAPVVIVIGTNSAVKAGKQDVIYKNREFGLGLRYYDFEKKTREETAVFNYISKKNDEAAIEEEARLLYVALTRAKVRLFVVAERRAADARTKDPKDANKLIDFIYPDDMEHVDRSKTETAFDAAPPRRTPALPSADEELALEISEGLTKKYPFEKDVTLSLKRTVTEVVKSGNGEDFSDGAAPVFKAADVEHGNAYHKFLELCSLSDENVGQEKQRLFDEGKLTIEDLAVLEDDKLEKILGSPIFKELSDYKLYRERPFIVNVPAALVGEEGDGEVLLQGVIDLLAVKRDKAVIVDYKFSFASDETLAKRYEKQLGLYAFAVKKILGVGSVEKILFNINLGSFVKV